MFGTYTRKRTIPPWAGHYLRKPDNSFTRFASAVRRSGKRNLLDEIMDPVRVSVAAGDAPPDLVAALAAYTRRPFYSPEELARLWPVVSVGLCGKSRGLRPTASAVRSNLALAGLPLLQRVGGSTWFMKNGRMHEFFIVSDVRHWTRGPISQETFDAAMAGDG
jgi:hypothetical protein